MAIQQFNSAQTSLQAGINLIEASAGTGKTYAIAMLALRFIVELEMSIEQVLIVTFTNAATDELKARVRLRLIEAKQALSGDHENLDATIIDWVEQLTVDHNQVIQRLEMALLDIDRAGILTIHGFCQRLLKEHALETGQLFDSKLSTDISAIEQACADDYWRQQVYLRDVEQSSVLLSVAATPDQLLKTIKGISPAMQVIPEVIELDLVLAQFCCHIKPLRPNILQTALTLEQAFSDKKFTKTYTQSLQQHWPDLMAWCQQQSKIIPSPECFQLLTEDGLLSGLSGSLFRNSKISTAQEKKQEYLNSLGITDHKLNEIPAQYHQVALSFRRQLYDYIQTQLTARLQQLNILSFDDLIGRVSAVLKEPGGVHLIDAVQEQYKAALIDEFQDTDASQWHIFSTLFADPAHYLFLIGDPKQAIYKFRGADIYSYFAAQQQADFQYTLDQNWRSHPQLVQAVNTLFERRPAPFLFQQLPFHAAKAALDSRDGQLLFQQQPSASMVIWQLAENNKSSGYWSSNIAGEKLQIAVINEILKLLNPEQGYQISQKTKSNRLVSARDIAILVRTNRHAAEYQAILRHVGIPSVINSNDSVFSSIEAANLYTLLQAIAHPGDVNLLKQALTLAWFDFDAMYILSVSEDENQLDLWLSRFQLFYQQWHKQGLMAMMLALLEQLGIQENMAASLDAERQLTNVYHLLELLQQAVVEEHLGILKTLNWLQRAISSSENHENRQLRLESDQQAVKIVTMHRAKGLEYPIVFCPYLWSHNNRIQREQNLLTCHQHDTIIADLGSEEFEKHRELAIHEQLAEDLRLLYVALTRAKYRCYLLWADVRIKNIRNQSALDYLLFTEQETGFTAQQQTLSTLCGDAKTAFEFYTLPSEQILSGCYSRRTETSNLAARQSKRSLHSYWQMSSFTALSALSLADAPETPLDKVQEPVDSQVNSEDEEQVLPKGATTGNVVHSLLETIDFLTLAGNEDITSAMAASCLHYGLQLDYPESLRTLLRDTVLSPLSAEDPDFCLHHLEDQACLKEMPFYLSLESINTEQINALLSSEPAYKPLNAKQMQGYLTGFIDLICLYQGRYYVMDYKTNTLPDYQAATLTAAMREHNYGLQYWIYTLVLHHYLQQRIPGYDYQQHFGGVRYLFVRGMSAQNPMLGVFEDYPEYSQLQALAQLFGGDDEQ